MNSFKNVPDEIMRRLAEKQLAIALVGASNDPEKFGNRIMKNLLAKGYSILPVNPKESVIEGIPVISRVADLPKNLAFVTFVVPPKVTLSALPEALAAGVDGVWFQDGSFDDAVLAFASANFKYVAFNACVMVVSNYV